MNVGAKKSSPVAAKSREGLNLSRAVNFHERKDTKFYSQPYQGTEESLSSQSKLISIISDFLFFVEIETTIDHCFYADSLNTRVHSALYHLEDTTA